LEEDFQYELNIKKEYKTPAGPRTVITRLLKGEDQMTSTEITKYRSGVGMLLYLVKNSRPDSSNAV
jgi:hypothetical protein